MQVPLGILPKNETKGDEMVDIMKYVQDNYIPYKAYNDKVTVSTGEVVDVVTALFGGDQLTAVIECDVPRRQG